ncbi:MAG: ISAs1 family transposase [Acidobacteriaceae bacterium]
MILVVKENQGHLLDEIKDSSQMLAVDAFAEEIDCGHGRVEQRVCSIIADLSLLEKAAEWASLQGLVRIQSERYHKATGKTEREIRYDITSLKPDARWLNASIRQHRGIENKLYGWWMSASMRTLIANAQATPRRTSPCSTASLSICSNKTKPQSAVSTAKDLKPVGIMITCYICSEIKMRLPCQPAAVAGRAVPDAV